MKLPEGSMFIRAGSHRCRDAIEWELGRKPQSWYSFYEERAIEIRPDEWDKVKDITGVTRARIKHPDKMHPCWQMDAVNPIAKLSPKNDP